MIDQRRVRDRAYNRKRNRQRRIDSKRVAGPRRLLAAAPKSHGFVWGMFNV